MSQTGESRVGLGAELGRFLQEGGGHGGCPQHNKPYSGCPPKYRAPSLQGPEHRRDVQRASREARQSELDRLPERGLERCQYELDGERSRMQGGVGMRQRSPPQWR